MLHLVTLASLNFGAFQHEGGSLWHVFWCADVYALPVYFYLDTGIMFGVMFAASDPARMKVIGTDSRLIAFTSADGCVLLLHALLRGGFRGHA